MHKEKLGTDYQSPDHDKTGSASFIKQVDTIRFIHQTLIMITGISILYFVSQDNFRVPNSLYFILGWLTLVIAFPTPKVA